MGKITLVKKYMPQRTYLSFDDLSLLSATKLDPVGFDKTLPEQITLDEVQRVPELMPAIKSAVDKTGKFCCSTVDLSGRLA